MVSAWCLLLGSSRRDPLHDEKSRKSAVPSIPLESWQTPDTSRIPAVLEGIRTSEEYRSSFMLAQKPPKPRWPPLAPSRGFLGSSQRGWDCTSVSTRTVTPPAQPPARLFSRDRVAAGPQHFARRQFRAFGRQRVLMSRNAAGGRWWPSIGHAVASRGGCAGEIVTVRDRPSALRKLPTFQRSSPDARAAAMLLRPPVSTVQSLRPRPSAPARSHPEPTREPMPLWGSRRTALPGTVLDPVHLHHINGGRSAGYLTSLLRQTYRIRG